MVLSLRKTSKKYYFLHPAHAEQDKADIMPVIKQFAFEFDIPYDKIKLNKSGNAVYCVRSSEKGEGDGFSTPIQIWLILRWYKKYTQGLIEYREPTMKPKGGE